MRPRPKTMRAGGLLATSLVLVVLAARPAQADEPQGGGRLGRLFRFGPSNTAPAAPHESATAPASTVVRGMTSPPTLETPPATPDVTHGASGPRITPQPRVSKPPTEADPIVTRISIGRSDGGGQFGMFLQVFADGTVMDSEGVHRVGPDVMKPLIDVLHLSELSRLKGHCGAPSTDFIEQAHVVLYERSYGKLKATSFSYSGNPQGCDPSVRRLHAALDAIQTKLAGTPATTTTASHAPTNPSPYSRGTPVLSLTPPNP